MTQTRILDNTCYWYFQLSIFVNQVEKAKEAIQAVNAAWAVVRDSTKRSVYNRQIVEKAFEEEREATQQETRTRQASTQKQRVNETTAAFAAKKPKASGKQQETPPTKKTGEPKAAASKSSSSKGSGSQGFEFVKLHQHAKHLVCRSTMNKFHRKFEHKAYAGEKHATAVAKAFQNEAERMATVHLSLTKLEGLKQFCVEHGIEVPDGKLTKQLMYESIEEANGFKNNFCSCLLIKDNLWTFLSSVLNGTFEVL